MEQTAPWKTWLLIDIATRWPIKTISSAIFPILFYAIPRIATHLICLHRNHTTDLLLTYPSPCLGEGIFTAINLWETEQHESRSTLIENSVADPQLQRPQSASVCWKDWGSGLDSW
jgi:hypothetical protein